MTGWLHVCSCGNPAKYVVAANVPKNNRHEVCGVHLTKTINQWLKRGPVTVDTIERAHGDAAK